MKPKVIFFGNGKLAEVVLAKLQESCEIIFHARVKEDLEEVKRLKREVPEAHGVLASYGVMIREDVLGLFEPEGILNVHPSLLPKYRGASPIESAILNGDSEFSVSVMKLVRAMDAGPIYFALTVKDIEVEKIDKWWIYEELGMRGADWIGWKLGECAKAGVKWISDLVEAKEQEGEATFTTKLDKGMSRLTPEVDGAEKCWRKVMAFAGFPKAKYDFLGRECIILGAKVGEARESELDILCADGKYLVVTELQPAGKRGMDVKSFLNGYKK